jgi:hypothetical protein
MVMMALKCSRWLRELERQRDCPGWQDGEHGAKQDELGHW